MGAMFIILLIAVLIVAVAWLVRGDKFARLHVEQLRHDLEEMKQERDGMRYQLEDTEKEIAYLRRRVDRAAVALEYVEETAVDAVRKAEHNSEDSSWPLYQAAGRANKFFQSVNADPEDESWKTKDFHSI